jgi:SRSO17 transposase
LADHLDAFVSRFSGFFRSKTRSVEDSASRFIKGLFKAERRNMQQISEAVAGTDRQNLQYLLSEAKWDHVAVQRQIAQDANRHLGGRPDTCLIIDESGFAKKGRHSAGVGRQWNGRLGKVDNCQVGVFAALARGTAVTLIAGRLYLPADWVKDRKRCVAAGIPEEDWIFLSKCEIALKQVREARAAGVDFAWTCIDGGYGKDPAFLRALDDSGERFMADVHRTQRLYLEDPSPAAKGMHGRGESSGTDQAQDGKPLTIESWSKQLPSTAWTTVMVRQTTTGPLNVRCASQRVWLWDKQESKAREWTALVVMEIDKPEEIHYALSNAPAEMPTSILAKVERQRFWVEHALGEAKSEIGLGHYEVRTWTGWHRHMTLCMMAQLFMLEERLSHAEGIPLLSARDIRSVLVNILPSPASSRGGIFRQIHSRHRQRWDATRKRYEKLGISAEFHRFGDSTM